MPEALGTQGIQEGVAMSGAKTMFKWGRRVEKVKKES